MRILFWILALFIAVVFAIFAASNREMLSLGLWPLPWLLQIPAYLAVLGALLIGFLAGALAAWIGGRHSRRELRQRRRQLAALEHELVATQAQLAEGSGMPPVSVAAER